MPARDKVHNSVRQALINDGWTITDDPLEIQFGSNKVQIDLGAERLLAAEKGTEKIAVEVKSFLGFSLITEFYHALGQFLTYRIAVTAKMPERVLYLAIPIDAYEDLANSDLMMQALQQYEIKLLIFSPRKEVVTKWIN